MNSQNYVNMRMSKFNTITPFWYSLALILGLAAMSISQCMQPLESQYSKEECQEKLKNDPRLKNFLPLLQRAINFFGPRMISGHH